MKSLIKMATLMTLLALASCSHHGKMPCCEGEGANRQCKMDKKDCGGKMEGQQCPMDKKGCAGDCQGAAKEEVKAEAKK